MRRGRGGGVGRTPGEETVFAEDCHGVYEEEDDVENPAERRHGLFDGLRQTRRRKQKAGSEMEVEGSCKSECRTRRARVRVDVWPR